MKRLCVFYYKADEWLGKPINWIVCKYCSRQLAKGMILVSVLPNILALSGLPTCGYASAKGRKARAKNAS